MDNPVGEDKGQACAIIGIHGVNLGFTL